MELTHRLTYNNTTTVIQEPIGFDSLKVQISRHEYHGIGAELSMDALEFYGNAINIISNAYATDIDSSIVYDVLDGSTVIYTGKLDLSTYKELRGDYRSISCRVGEIGDMTTFNNRTDKEIDIDDPKTVDGAVVSTPDWLELHIPKKSLFYTNLGKQKNDTQVPESGTISIGGSNRYLVLPFVNDVYSEFGKFEFTGAYCTEDESNIEAQYDINEGDPDKFGSGITSHIDVVIKATLNLGERNMWSFRYKMVAVDFFGNTITEPMHSIDDTRLTEIPINSHIEGDLSASHPIKFYLYVDPIYGSVHVDYNITAIIKSGSYIKMTMYDTLPDDEVNTKMLLVHDALNVISHAISENALSVKSDWYCTPESHWEPGAIRTIANGKSGALKAITNGYHIRGLFTDGETQRNMPMSFKEIIESLDAMDCIGWGFSVENNALCLRVERWDWFYKNSIVITLLNAAEVTTEVYTDRIPTELKIGYKKFATQDQYNSIDSPHGTRTFANGIKALSKTINKESEFIADNYAIEETRRARTQVSETEETTYDENVFVFELGRNSGGAHLEASYTVAKTARNASNVGRSSEFINAKLTPRHMAARWRDYLFATNNSTDFRFISGEINYKSSFETYPENQQGVPLYYTYLDSFATQIMQTENDNITNIPAKFKAEKITFSYPLTIEQYETIKANPYGLIRVVDASGETRSGWILDFKYSLQDGMADFTLLARNDQINN